MSAPAVSVPLAAPTPPVVAPSDSSSSRSRRRTARSRSRSRSRGRRSRSRSRSRSVGRNSSSRSHRRHRRRHSTSNSRSPSRSHSPRRRRTRRTRRRSRSRTRSRSDSKSPRRRHHQSHHSTSRRYSRSRSASRRRHSRSRERRERQQQLQPAMAAPPAPQPAFDRRPPLVVTREQREPPPRQHRGYHDQRDHSSHQHRRDDPLARRPPPPPVDRPASLLSHVLPSSKGKYAYVFLVMKGDSYACGAIVSAYSLKLSGTPHSLVCMVTPDVTSACRDRMRLVFHEVIEVPYVQFEVKPLRTQKQRNMYNSWVDAAFTKWNMLSLIQYEKTLFFDADKICTGNLDHLFEEMSTPAGTFSSPWSEPFVERKDQIAQRSGKGSQRGKYNNSRGMMNPYKQNGHNSRVTSQQIFTALTEQSFVVIGTVVLLSPNMEDYEQYKAMLTQLQPFGFSDCHSMMDEQSLSYYFSIWKNRLISCGDYGKLTGGGSPLSLPPGAYSEWSYIHHMYNYVPWHRYWLTAEEVPYCFHFFSTKPWSLDRNAWLDLEAWWELVLAMLKDESIPAEGREQLRTIYPQEMLTLPKNEGCCWCRLTEESFMAPADGAWKRHNVFDSAGRLACPVMQAGFARDAARREEKKQITDTPTSSSSTQ